MKQFLAVLWLALVALAAPAAAQTFPALTGRVVDQAHLLTAAQVVDITSKSEALEAQTGRQFVVATVNSLEGYPIEDYAYRLGRAWKHRHRKKTMTACFCSSRPTSARFGSRPAMAREGS